MVWPPDPIDDDEEEEETEPSHIREACSEEISKTNLYKTTQDTRVVIGDRGRLLTRLIERCAETEYRQGRRGRERLRDTGDLCSDEESDAPIATDLANMRHTRGEFNVRTHNKWNTDDVDLRCSLHLRRVACYVTCLFVRS